MHLNLFVSNECFFYCKGCYSLSKFEQRGKCLTIDEITAFLKFVRSKGVDRVTLCGGDPLTRSDIIPLLEKINVIGLKVSLDTVGAVLLKDIELAGKTLKRIDVAQISKLVDIIGIPIDGSTDEICRKFRNSSRFSLEEQIEICKLLHKHNIRICINTVAHRQNLDDSTALCKTVENLGFINKWQIFQFSPQSRNCKEEYEITLDEFETFKNSITENFKGENTSLEFKNCSDRKNLYTMIDNDGNAWIPTFSEGYNDINKRSVIGNIKNQTDWHVISHGLINQ